ncbi:RNA-dependent RNA polymerase [Lentinula edodes]|uniref:RNA-dependent RNA polymerase n=1 Tax=Lentinula edodes TaxID=5353 RepID=A0A1Q3EF64_LENED|nr:RNA-dependent RNA polymerase [Lentinula edodes]
MILEDLGVPYETFEDLQEEAIEHTRRATESLATAARLLENFGLGNSFRLTSILLGLSRLGVDNHIQAEPFHRSVLNYAVHHILRELKHHTRIPVEGAWNLVGVADEHGFLQEGEIFAAIKEPNGAIQYLEGECIVTRSPAIHPGDCQIAIAIGPPPSGSCFAREPLTNTVVFPTIGSRPMPSMLGGGDLDGDTYNVIPLNIHPQLRPTITVDPASYARPTRKLLDQGFARLGSVTFFFLWRPIRSALSSSSSLPDQLTASLSSMQLLRASLLCNSITGIRCSAFVQDISCLTRSLLRLQ